MSFKDYFSKQASNYVRYRPLYPKELFKYLSGLCMERAGMPIPQYMLDAHSKIYLFFGFA